MTYSSFMLCCHVFISQVNVFYMELRFNLGYYIYDLPNSVHVEHYIIDINLLLIFYVNHFFFPAPVFILRQIS